MKETTIKGRCRECCPDGGAIFDRWGANEKKCRNCGTVFPFRRIKPTGKPTPSQQRVIDLVTKTFGGELKTEIIGRKVWFSTHNPARHWISGDSLYGTIHPGGRFEITLQRIGGDVKITDTIGISVYLR
jgi:hypothetical protein